MRRVIDCHYFVTTKEEFSELQASRRFLQWLQNLRLSDVGVLDERTQRPPLITVGF